MEERNPRSPHRLLLALATGFFVLLLAALAFFGWKAGIFRSLKALQQFIDRCGVWAPLVFIGIQICQILLAWIPGGPLLTGGVAAFGPWAGLMYNMLGTLAGSSLNFWLARRWGRNLVCRLTSEKTQKKYLSWLDSDRFSWMFAGAILLPFFPDDALCLIAGLSRMSWKRFLPILLLKLPSVAVYSVLYLAAT